MDALCGSRAVKFDSYNNLLSSVHTILVIILLYVRLDILNENIIIINSFIHYKNVYKTFSGVQLGSDFDTSQCFNLYPHTNYNRKKYKINAVCFCKLQLPIISAYQILNTNDPKARSSYITKILHLKCIGNILHWTLINAAGKRVNHPEVPCLAISISSSVHREDSAASRTKCHYQLLWIIQNPVKSLQASNQSINQSTNQSVNICLFHGIIT